MGKPFARCPKCGRTANGVELIYPRTDEYEEKRVNAFICPHCRYLFAEPNDEKTDNNKGDEQ